MRAVSNNPKMWCRKKARFLAVYMARSRTQRKEHFVCEAHSHLTSEYTVTPLVAD